VDQGPAASTVKYTQRLPDLEELRKRLHVHLHRLPRGFPSA
jgi:hypothetical protein